MKRKNIQYLFISVILLQFSCKGFLKIDPPKNSLVQETVFQNNDQASSAIRGIYSTMSGSSSYASGGSLSITCYAGLSSDELIGYNATNIPFYENQITPEISSLPALYMAPYQTIYSANSILEGLEAPNGVTPPVKSQLEGEALFIRAFSYFYLVNMFGAVPLQLTTDYRITQISPRTSINKVYQQITSDLLAAEDLLTDNYPTTGRVRPNRTAVQALLARSYLYQQDWINAEKYSTLVIKNNTYNLVALDAIFLADSQETIWQLMPMANSNTQDGNLFILNSTPTIVSLNQDFALNAFENNDKRRTSWVKSYTNSSGTYYYPFKYKIKNSTAVTEYSMVLRLAEQYLIRAEARAQQDNLNDAINDLDKIRFRAGISLIKDTKPNIGKSELLSTILKERRIELFSEWGHRWFDLKRTGKAGEVLSLVKSKWDSIDVLYPIPVNEILRNPNINQTDGY